MTTILVTGAFGNIGRYITKKLAELNYHVLPYDCKTKKTEKVSRQFKHETRICWGDITDSETLNRLDKELIDGVIHLAFVIPPLTELHPGRAEKVNVCGTRTLINFLTERRFQGPVVFASSTSVFGYTQDEPPPVTVDHPVHATDAYTTHKIQCEKMFQESDLDWRIVRYSAVTIPAQQASKDDLDVVFRIPLATRVEPVHVEDVATATVNALIEEKASQKVLIIAGGPKNRTYWKDYFVKLIEPYVGKVAPDDLPQEKFFTDPYYLDWYDTTASQKILQYQHHTLDTYLQESYDALGMKRVIFWLMRPLAKREILG